MSRTKVKRSDEKFRQKFYNMLQSIGIEKPLGIYVLHSDAMGSNFDHEIEILQSQKVTNKILYYDSQETWHLNYGGDFWGGGPFVTKEKDSSFTAYKKFEQEKETEAYGEFVLSFMAPLKILLLSITSVPV